MARVFDNLHPVTGEIGLPGTTDDAGWRRV